jgi:ATP-binding cassette subfamily F protein 3
MERFIERFRYKATKARQAQSRLKKLAKMDRLDPASAGSGQKELQFVFSAPGRSGRVVFELLDGRIEVGGDGAGPALTLLEQAELWLERGEHVTLVGPNGAGKTMLIETLARRRELTAGKLSVGHNVSVGYLSQHADELGRGGLPCESVLDAAQRATGLTPNKARSLLGRFLFSGAEAEKPLEGLSGGERRRLSLAILVSSGANVLLLDEPTNHLDIESREALEDALRSFAGAILLISHDRALLDAVGTRTIALEERSLNSYLGGWPEYVRVREERKATAGAPDAGGAPAGVTSAGGVTALEARAQSARRQSAPPKGGPRKGARGQANGAQRDGSRPKPKGPSKNRLREQAKAERAVETAEEALAALEEELSDPAAWASKYEAAKSEARHTAARRAIEDAYARLEALLD